MIYCHLGPKWACFRVLWGPRTLQNPSDEQNFSKYVLLWVQEQMRAFITDFWAIWDCFPVGGHFFPFWSHPPPHTPHNHQIAWLSSVLWLTHLQQSHPRWLAQNRTLMKNLVHFYFSFFQFLETVVFLGLFWAYYRVFWAPTNLQNPSMELIYSEYVCVWVREQNRAFIWDFWVVCDFSLQGCHFSPFWSLWGHVFQLWPRCPVIGWNR